MSGRKRTRRRVRDPDKLQRQTKERLTELHTQLTDVIDDDVERSLEDLVTVTEEVARTEEDVQQLYTEAQFLTQSADTQVAYATLSSLEEQGYELKATITTDSVRATFARPESSTDSIDVSIETDHTEDAYEEILDVYGDDDCIDFLDTYDYHMRRRGVEKESKTDITPNYGGERERSPHRSRDGRETDRPRRRSRR